MFVSRQQEEEKKLLQLVKSLADTIAFHCPDRCNLPSDSLTQPWMQQLILEGYSKEAAGEIFTKAIQLWCHDTDSHNDVSTTGATGSTSTIIDLSWSSGMSKPRVFFEDIQQATDKLTVLQQVDHVDDISMDWDYIHGLLNVGIRVKETAQDYLDIATTWYDQADGMMRVLLTEFVADTIVAVLALNDDSTAEDSDEWLFRLLQAWMYMWKQILGKSLDTSRIDQIGTAMLLLWKANEQVANFLAKLDPHGIWFHKWVQVKSSIQVRERILDNDLVPTLLHRCEVNDDTPLKRQSISIINSILLHTRLSQFPSKDNTQIHRLASILLASSLGDTMTKVGTQGMESIIWGCYHDATIYQHILELLFAESYLSGDLIAILGQVQEAVDPDSPFSIEVGRLLKHSSATHG